MLASFLAKMKITKQPNNISHNTRLMPASDWIKYLADRIAIKAKPEKIILFGSYAHGKPGPDSDIDILVVLDKPPGKIKRCDLVNKAIGDHLYPLDILIRNQKELAQRISLKDSFFMDIIDKGRVLYES